MGNITLSPYQDILHISDDVFIRIEYSCGIGFNGSFLYRNYGQAIVVHLADRILPIVGQQNLVNRKAWLNVLGLIVFPIQLLISLHLNWWMNSSGLKYFRNPMFKSCVMVKHIAAFLPRTVIKSNDEISMVWVKNHGKMFPIAP